VLKRRTSSTASSPSPLPSVRTLAMRSICACKDAVSKSNQAMTSDLTPPAAPTNFNELRAKNPERTHPDRDPITHLASLFWPQKANTGAWWEDDEGQEYIQKWFSISHIAKYFRTRSPVIAADIDGWCHYSGVDRRRRLVYTCSPTSAFQKRRIIIL